MPLLPSTAAGPEGFGPGQATSLGAGAYPGQEMMGGDPTDPNAEVSMGQMPMVTPGGVAEAMQSAIEQRQALFEQAAQQQLVADLTEADAWIQQVMATVGAEGSTLDGGGLAPPGPLPAPPAGPPAGPDDGSGIGAAAMGEAGPMGAGAVTPEMLAGMLG